MTDATAVAVAAAALKLANNWTVLYTPFCSCQCKEGGSLKLVAFVCRRDALSCAVRVCALLVLCCPLLSSTVLSRSGDGGVDCVALLEGRAASCAVLSESECQRRQQRERLSFVLCGGIRISG